MPKTALQILEEARELVSRLGGWTQGALARDETGEEVYPTSPDARSWDVVGAVALKGAAADEVRELWRAVCLLKRTIEEQEKKPAAPLSYESVLSSLGAFNDETGRTQAEVAALFDAAIAAAQESKDA